MRVRDEAKAEVRRREILEAAAACFVRRGFHQTTMNEICTEADISPGGLYRYFESKEEIVVAIAEADRSDTHRLLGIMDGSDDVVEGLIAVFRLMIPAVADPDYGRLGLEVTAEAARNPKVGVLFTRNQVEVRNRLAVALGKGQSMGQVDKNLDPSAAAEVLLSIIDGLAGLATMQVTRDVTQLQSTLDETIRRLLRPTDFDA
ncbi:MAG: TetR/AcrR family transcriptional regulator [Alphaproteobacteria bacterium]